MIDQISDLLSFIKEKRLMWYGYVIKTDETRWIKTINRSPIEETRDSRDLGTKYIR